MIGALQYYEIFCSGKSAPTKSCFDLVLAEICQQCPNTCTNVVKLKNKIHYEFTPWIDTSGLRLLNETRVYFILHTLFIFILAFNQSKKLSLELNARLYNNTIFIKRDLWAIIYSLTLS